MLIAYLVLFDLMEDGEEIPQTSLSNRFFKLFNILQKLKMDGHKKLLYDMFNSVIFHQFMMLSIFAIMIHSMWIRPIIFYTI